MTDREDSPFEQAEISKSDERSASVSLNAARSRAVVHHSRKAQSMALATLRASGALGKIAASACWRGSTK
jgi:hypothetical protein